MCGSEDRHAWNKVSAVVLLGLRRAPDTRRQAAAAHDACLAYFGPDHRRTVEARTRLEQIDGIRP
ncbi:hypothetical protein [Streptomyces sp. NPDC052610]|uniref:hypothetical protein n=1 Tax=Streptomyces sp. NPDC052610 TaxID=3154952 RepID=UPI00343428FE